MDINTDGIIMAVSVAIFMFYLLFGWVYMCGPVMAIIFPYILAPVFWFLCLDPLIQTIIAKETPGWRPLEYVAGRALLKEVLYQARCSVRASFRRLNESIE